jgi:hypothetical protein
VALLPQAGHPTASGAVSKDPRGIISLLLWRYMEAQSVPAVGQQHVHVCNSVTCTVEEYHKFPTAVSSMISTVQVVHRSTVCH